MIKTYFYRWSLCVVIICGRKMFPLIVLYIYLNIFVKSEAYINLTQKALIEKLSENFFIGNTIVIINDKENLFPNIALPKVITNGSNLIDLEYNGMLLHNYVIFVNASPDWIQSLKNVLFVLKNRVSWEARPRILLFIQNLELLRDTFHTLRESLIFKAIVIERSTGSMYRFNLSDYCNNFTYTKLSDQNVQKDYFKNCNVSVLWSQAEPYIMNPKMKTHAGIFIDLISTVGRYDNLNLTYEMANKQLSTEIKESGTYYSVYDSLDNGTGDIYLAAINLQYDLSDMFDMSIGIWEDKILWVVPKEENRFSWETICQSFSIWEWIILFIMFVTVGYIFKLLAKEDTFFQNIHNCYLYIYSLSLGVSYNNSMCNDRIRIFFVLYVWPTFVLCTFFQGRLYTMLSLKVESQALKNVDDVFALDLPIIADENFGISLIIEDTKYSVIFDKIIPSNSTKKEMLEMAVKNNYITVINEGLLITNPHMINKFKSLNFYKYKNIILIRREHILTERINMQIRRLQESGIIGKWFSDLQWSCYIKNHNDVNNNYNQKQTFTVLSLTHLTGAIVVLSIGSSAALLIFVIELLKSIH